MTEEEVEAQLRKAFGMKAPSAASAKTAASPKKKKKKSSYTSIYPIFGLMFLFMGLSAYMIAPEFFDGLFDRVEIQAFSEANAKEGQKTPPSKVEAAEKTASAQSQEEPNPEDKKAPSVSEDTSYLSKLKERQAALDLREAELNQLEEELQKQKVEIGKRIEELTKIREEIASKLEDRVQADEGKVKKLVDLYSSMKPKQAAKIIESVNRDLAVEVLANMKKKSAADIMNVMDEKVARELSERLAGYKRIPASVN